MDFSAPPTGLSVLWGLWVGQAAWCCWNVHRFARRIGKQRGRYDRALEPPPPVAVIVPVKGAGPDFAQHVHGLTHQDYDDYRLIFSVESEDDPAHAAIQTLIESADRAAGLRSIRCVVAGRARRGGQKVHNQRGALQTLEERDAVIVFADADAVPGANWLRAMVAGLNKSQYEAATAYRWMVPADRGWPSRFASAINGSVATLLGRGRWNLAWGGSMAITRDMMRRAQLAERWDGALSDDHQFTRAVHDAGSRIYFLSTAMPLSPVRFTWAALWEFGRRQHRITRVHDPLTWLLAFALLSLYLAGWIGAGIGAAMGIGWAWAAMAAVTLCDAGRGWARRAAARGCFGDRLPSGLGPLWALECLGTPLWMALHWLMALTGGLGRKIRWAGITYDMRGPQDVRILRRDEPGAGR